MKIKLVLITVIIISCENPQIPYLEFNGVEYLHCDDYYFGQVFIKEIETYTIDEILEFAYCMSVSFDFDCLAIRSEYYPAASLWTGKSKGHTLITICLDLKNISKSDTAVIWEKNITKASYINKGTYVEIPKELYQIQYECP